MRTGLREAPDELDAPVLVGDALNVALALEGIETVQHRLVGGNVTPGLNFPDDGRVSVLGVKVLEEFEHRVLLRGQETFVQRGVQR
jgi:hypothetical protein